MAKLNNEKYLVAKAMRRYGGLFVKALGEALEKADSINTAKIKDTWTEYWEKYLEMAEDLH